jgi:hypothetical protein
MNRRGVTEVHKSKTRLNPDHCWLAGTAFYIPGADRFKMSEQGFLQVPRSLAALADRSYVLYASINCVMSQLEEECPVYCNHKKRAALAIPLQRLFDGYYAETDRC